MGIRDGIDLRIKIQSSPYFNKELFIEYVREVFLPAVESNRELPECRGKRPILFATITYVTLRLGFDGISRLI
jgi:hypothetical protein